MPGGGGWGKTRERPRELVENDLARRAGHAGGARADIYGYNVAPAPSGGRIGGTMGLIDGKVAIVTGGGTGIGRETALLLAREGATVVVVGRRNGPLDEVVAEIQTPGGKAMRRPLESRKRERSCEAVALGRSARSARSKSSSTTRARQQGAQHPLDQQEEWERRSGSTSPRSSADAGRAARHVAKRRRHHRHGVVARRAAPEHARRRGLRRGQSRRAQPDGLHARHLPQPQHPRDDDPARRGQHADHGHPRAPAAAEERAAMVDPDDVARAVLLCCTLPQGADDRELRHQPDLAARTRADIEISRWLGAPDGTPGKPEN